MQDPTRRDVRAMLPPLRGLEAWLRSPPRMLLLALAVVVVGAAASSLGRIEVRLARDRGPSVDLVLRTELLNWALLVALAMPLGYLLVSLGRRARRWPVAAGALLLASTAVASALFVQQNYTAVRVMESQRDAADGERPRREFGSFPRGEGRGERGRRAGSGDVADAAPGDAPGDAPEPTPEAVEEQRRRWALRARMFNLNSTDLVERLGARWSIDFPRVLLATWALVGLGAAIRLFLDGRDREREAQRLALRASTLEGELGRAQLDSLRAQLHPHFLFNALHSIGGLVRARRGETALQTLDALGVLLRSGLEAHGEALVPLREELALLDRYLQVERVRLGDRLAVEVDASEDVLDAEVPPFLLQPLVENAVRHAVASRAGGGRVRIRARADGPRLVLEVDDDGPGFDAAALAGSSWRVGLANVRGRLTTLFEASASLELGVAEELGGARVRLVLPRDEEGEPRA